MFSLLPAALWRARKTRTGIHDTDSIEALAIPKAFKGATALSHLKTVGMIGCLRHIEAIYYCCSIAPNG